MASAARVFNRSVRFSRHFKLNRCSGQKLTNSLHVSNQPNCARNLTHVQLSRPMASISGLLNASLKCNLRTKIQYVSPQSQSVSLLPRSASFLSSSNAGSSDESNVSCSEGSESSCEAMEGPHGDDDGLVIHHGSIKEDL